MKYLKDYTTEPMKALMSSTGAFWAFGQEQFDEKSVEGVKYASLGAGLICPVDSVKAFNEGYDKVIKDAIAEDIKENGKEGIIKRELINHECFYTGEVESVVDELKSYGYTEEDIIKVYRKVAPTMDTW